MIAESRMKTVAEGGKQKANYRFAILDLSINSATGNRKLRKWYVSPIPQFQGLWILASNVFMTEGLSFGNDSRGYSE
jgi:hypothetical protein